MKKIKKAKKSQIESIPIVRTGVNRTGEIKRKYCLAYRQGAIGIETAEIKMRMWHLENEFEIRQKDQVRWCADKNQSPII